MKNRNKIHLITYGDGTYQNAKERIKKQAEHFGVFDSITTYGKKDLPVDFATRFKTILNKRKGGGYWIWKPYLVNKKLQEIQDGEYLVYLDCGCGINKNGIDRFNEYIDMLDNSDKGVLSFQFIPDDWRTETKWTNLETFNYFEIDLDSNTANSGQYVGGIFILKKNAHSLSVVKKWLDVLYEKPSLFTDSLTNRDIEVKEFMEHRHDQSVFSLTRKIYGSIVLSDETKFPTGSVPMKFNSENQYPFWALRRRK